MSSIPAPRPSEFESLVVESEALEQAMSMLQDEPAPTMQEVGQVRRDYRDWHARARRLLVGDAVNRFDDQRDGNVFSPGVSKFLDDPRQESVLKAYDGSFPMGRWQYPFKSVRGRLEKQRSILLEAAPTKSSAETVADELAEVLRRLPTFMQVLQRRREQWRVGEAIADEHDLQVVVEALLRALFDDVRPEDYVPSRAGSNSRVDFVMPEVGVVVETKMTRANLTASKLGEELLVDAGRYPKHPECSAIVALVYDPDQRIENPRGLEGDLTSRTESGLSFVCVVVS
ncbi:PD-(D/E)XK nuclease domain-containing protein [Nesterenkonia ebinurensis]|uniref:PD-(D/E)XK nuclease domain-containing protein n=1 Tax=Nesterenkonia ebinurensis TaxID=2608252 RepID=UPI00123DE93F|nr:hypothetical protein [Nesterenkonia ebinurensis]